MASSDIEEEDYYCSDDGDDQSCQSSCTYGEDGDRTDGDDESSQAELAEVDDSPERGKRYLVLTEDGLRARQENCTARVAELLSIPPGFAAVLLRHYKWSAVRLEDEWFLDEQRVRDDVGLPVGGAPAVFNDRPLACTICFDLYSPGEMVSAGCSHYYCRECWRGYIRAAVGDGPRCLSLRCPDPSCSVAVVRDLVQEVAGDGDRERYGMFALRSYVEESNKIRRWCPGPGCTHAAELLSGEQCTEPVDVFCPCSHDFCLRCGEEAHRPVSCETASKWLNSFESATTKYVLCHTKHCPECRRPIEKNKGCVHMTCPAPCYHEFCWLCLGPWDEQHFGTNYRCEIYNKAMAERAPHSDKEARREQAVALRRYLYYYDGWTANGNSRREALAELKQLQSEEIEKLTGWFGTAHFDFLVEAYEQIADSRRVLRWVHAYGCYLHPERDKLKRELFELLKTDAEEWLQRLQQCAASCKDTDELYGPADDGESYRVFKEKLAGLTAMTATRFRNLAEAFEGDLAEVKPVVDLPIHRASEPSQIPPTGW